MNVIAVIVAVIGYAAAQGCENPPACRPSEVLDTETCRCVCTYFESADPTKYVVKLPNFPIDVEMPCPVSLVWSQADCECVKSVTAGTGGSNDIGNPISCVTLADLKSNGTDFVNFVHYVQSYEKSGDIALENIAGAVDGKAANFKGISLYMPVFEYNDLTGTAMMKLRVRPTTEYNHTYEQNNQVLVSDACQPGYSPAIELSYNPAVRNFTLMINTDTTAQDMCENIPANQDGWYEIDVSILNGATSWSINGVPCPFMSGSGAIRNTKCGLTIGGNPLSGNDSEDFYGHIDYVKIVKHCDNEPVL